MTLATGNPSTSAAPAPTGPVGAAGSGAVAQQGRATPPRAPRTDRRLSRTRAVLAVGALLFGAAGITSTQIRADGADDVRAHSGVLLKQAEELYHSLSDADATAATIYLHVGEAPKALAAQYDTDLKDAQDLLLAATNGAGDDTNAKDLLTQIAQQLPTYVKLNATAAANNLVGYPVGIRYLTQASTLMQTGVPAQGSTPAQPGILQLVQKLTDAEAANLAAAEDTATQVPWLMAGAGALMLAALIVIQVRESRRTNRLFSLGLLGATAALVVSLLWAVAAAALQDSHIHNAKKRGSAQVSVLASARILSLQARTDEMLTLVGRGTADDRELDYTGGTDSSGARVPSTEGRLKDALNTASGLATDSRGRDLIAKALANENAWHTQHTQLRTFDAQNAYQKAVDSALGEHDFAAPKESANADFNALQTNLKDAIDHAEDTFTTEAKAAADALTGLQIGLGVLAVAMAAAVVVGLGRRLAEYH
ncbi:MAG: hypothetical protein HOW97_10800 [Catenulispora sp.]|nr:hypothetical protein [Catenulispora sp.]